MARPDSGKQIRIWATRPAQQNSAWAQGLRDQGFWVVELPLLAIEPITEDSLVQAAKQKVMNFDQSHKVIFVSQNAASEAAQWLDNYWPQLPEGIQFFAVGSKTAECVQAALDVKVESASVAMNTEELLALQSLADVSDQKLLICRGVGGLPKLGLELEQRGARMDYCELYHRRLPKSSIDMAAVILAETGFRDLVPVFSGQALENLDAILEHLKTPKGTFDLIVPGERVANLARDMGYVHIHTAKNATQEVMLAAIANYIS